MIGLLSAVRRRPRPWLPDEIAFLEAVAGQAVVALHNALVYGQSERWVGQLSVVQASVNRMNRLTTVAAVGEAVVEETRRVVDYHNCRVYVIEPPDVVPIAFRGEVGEYDTIPLDLLQTRIGEGFTGWVAENGEPLLIHDAERGPPRGHDPGHGQRGRVDGRGAHEVRRRDHRRGHALQARSAPVRPARPAADADPRQRRGHGHPVGPRPRRASAPRPACRACWACPAS